MHTQPKNKRRKGFAIFLGIVWGIMLVFYAKTAYDIMNYRNEIYYPDPVSMAYETVVGNYGGIYSRIDELIKQGVDIDDHTEYSELNAVHDYMEALANYRIYSKNGLSEQAAKNLALMDEAKSRMGGLDFAAKDIDAILGGH